MKYAEVRELLDKGFTAEYIMKMESSENSDERPQDPQQEPPKEPEPEPPKDPEPEEKNAMFEAFNKFGEKMDDLIKEMQAANIMNSRQKHDEPISAEDALASIIMPQNNK